jgi:Fe-S-cluster containining protein
MSNVFSPAEEALYFKTVDALQKRLGEAREPNDVLGRIRQAFAGFERAYASAPAKVRAKVACRAGCDTCCHERVAVQAHEVLIVAEHVQKHFSADALEALIARAADHRRAHAGRGTPEWVFPRTPCVLLSEGQCSVYEARPGICRAHHSHTVEGCKTNLAAGNEEVDVKIPGLRGRMFAVMLGIDQAVESVGYDEEAYDLGSALHEALTNSFCAFRWSQGKPAFPADCRESPPPRGGNAVG